MDDFPRLGAQPLNSFSTRNNGPGARAGKRSTESRLSFFKLTLCIQSFSHHPTLIATPAQDHKAYLHASKLFMSPPHSQGRSHPQHDDHKPREIKVKSESERSASFTKLFHLRCCSSEPPRRALHPTTRPLPHRSSPSAGMMDQARCGEGSFTT